jgi:hypothetical protein
MAFEVTAGQVTGWLEVQGRRYRLEEFGGVYTRLMDERWLPELAQTPPAFRCRLLERSLHHGQALWKAGHPSARMTVAQPVISPQEAPRARPAGLFQWQQTVSTSLPPLSPPQVTVLVLGSFGSVLAQACGLTTVAVTLA